MKIREKPIHTREDEDTIWGFGRIIRYMSEKAGGLGLFGPRNTF